MKRFFDDGRNEGNMVGTGYDQNTILQAVHTKWAGNTVHFVNETDSTNNWVRTLAAEGAPHGTLAVTESQTAGKGRLGRNWKTEEGSAVTMTLLLRPDFAPEYAPMLTLVMGLSVGQAVEQITVAGNFYELLKNITEAANDLYFTSGGKGAPSVRVREMDIAGK